MPFVLLVFSVVLIHSCSKKSGGGGSNPPPPNVPGCASNTAPANGTMLTTTSVTLTWNSVSGATGYDVYLGTTSSPSTVIASNVSSTSYSYTVPVTATSTTYYWYVQPKNATGGATGCATTVTSFTYTVIQAPRLLVIM